jgi:hypothetical protein
MTSASARRPIAPADVHAALARHMLADGYDLVLDLEKSKGRRLHDAKTGRWYLDMFSCFATLPVGINHPKMADAAFLERLTRAALINPTNSDVYTVEMAEFVSTFARVAMPPYLPARVLHRGRDARRGERDQGRFRLEGAAELPQGIPRGEGAPGAPLPQRLPRALGLRALAHEHRGSQEAPVLPEV